MFRNPDIGGVRVAHYFHFSFCVLNRFFTLRPVSWMQNIAIDSWLLLRFSSVSLFIKHQIGNILLYDFVLLVLNVTFSNISAISWGPVLEVRKAGGSGEPPTMGKQLDKFITSGCESSAPFL